VEAGRAPVIELASQMLVVALGLFLLWKALRPHAHRASGSGPVLAMAAGLVPWTLATMSAVAVLLLGLVPIVGRSL
jgi:nickel/cobalt exporter